MSGHAHGLAISSVQLGITGFWARRPVLVRRRGFLCIYVLLSLYTKHEDTKASSMPRKEQALKTYHFESRVSKDNLMIFRTYKLTK